MPALAEPAVRSATLADPRLPCVELLPSRASYARGAGLRWCPWSRTLALDTHRTKPARVYALTAVPVDPSFRGRAWCCRKAAGTTGTDPEAGEYVVFLSDGPRELDRCECKGFLRWGHCAHLDSVRAIDANGWFDLPVRPVIDPAEYDACVPGEPVTGGELEEMAARTPSGATRTRPRRPGCSGRRGPSGRLRRCRRASRTAGRASRPTCRSDHRRQTLAGHMRARLDRLAK